MSFYNSKAMKVFKDGEKMWYDYSTIKSYKASNNLIAMVLMIDAIYILNSIYISLYIQIVKNTGSELTLMIIFLYEYTVLVFSLIAIYGKENLLPNNVM